jgi:hypothetical protein
MGQTLPDVTEEEQRMPRAHIEVHGLRQLRRDLRTINRTLPTRLNRQLKASADPIRQEAAAMAPRSRINRGGGYVHFADSLKVGTRGSRVVIYSRKPGANVIHWGGRHPLFGNRDRWYAQQGNRVIPRAVARNVVRIERDVAATVERTLRTAGFK